MHMRNHLQKFKEEEKAVRLWLWRKRHFEKAKKKSNNLELKLFTR